MNRVIRCAVPVLLCAAGAFASPPTASTTAPTIAATTSDTTRSTAPVRFVETPGVLEFTGRLVVRPRQDLYAATNPRPNASPAKPWTPDLAGPQELRATDPARARLMPTVIEHFGEVDEYTVRVPLGMNENTYAEQLLATGDYEYAHPDWLCYPTDTVPNDSQFGSSWQHSRVQSAAAWDLYTGDPSVVVAIVDSGVDLDHPDLVDRLVPGFNAVSNLAQTGGGIVEDQNGHGTFCSGCAAASGNNGTGVVGMGWNLGVMPVRATSPGNGGTASSVDLNQGARWAADNGATTVNVSFSGVDSSSVQSTGEYCKIRGVLYFRSAGNDARDLSGFDHPDVVVVGASTSSDSRAGFSAFGRAVDLTAPGASVRGTRIGGGYGNSSGTSFSSPIAAGVAAMIMGANRSLSAQDAEDILFETCDVIGSEDTFGNGRVNLFRAVQEALNPGDLDLLLTEAIPETLEPGEALTVQMQVEIQGDTLAGAPELFVRTGGGTGFTAIPMTDLSGGLWSATLSPAECGDDPEFYLQATGLSEGTVTLPATGASQPYRAVVGEYLSLFEDTFETDQGWTVSGDAFSGHWERGVPAGDGLRGDPLTDADGSGAAFLTQNEAGNSDVDLGETILTSPSIDFSLGGTIRWFYWLADTAGPGFDSPDGLFVEISADGGDSWARVATYTTAQNAWRSDSIELPAVLASDDFRIRFIANDTGSAARLEAGVDGVRFARLLCNDGSSCPADFNADSAVDVFDILDYLTAWNALSPTTDYEADGAIDIFDILAFLAAWNAGCP